MTRSVECFSLDVVLALGRRLRSDKGEALARWLKGFLSDKDKEKPHPIVIFDNGSVSMDVLVSPEEETVWLTQAQIAELFEVSQQNASRHIQNILEEGELDGSTHKYYLYVAQDGKQRQVLFYNLDMILAVGYRARSKKATEFHFFCDSLLDSSTPFLTNPRNRFSF